MMTLEPLPQTFAICQVPDLSAVDFFDTFCFVGKTDEEISVVCEAGSKPANAIKCDSGWRAFRIAGPLDFSLIGILSHISTILAEQKIGIFAVSTYNTDYVLTRAENWEKALSCLEKAGCVIAR